MVASDDTGTDINLKQHTAKLDSAHGDEELFQAIVDAPFVDRLTAASMFLGVVVLLLVNKKNKTIDRIAICNTEIADRTKQGSIKRFEDIRIPLGHKENIIAQAIVTGDAQETADWKYLFVPELSPENARFNQADGGIAFSCVRPLTARDGGAMIFSFYQPKELVDADYAAFTAAYARLADEYLHRT